MSVADAIENACAPQDVERVVRAQLPNPFQDDLDLMLRMVAYKGDAVSIKLLLEHGAKITDDAISRTLLSSSPVPVFEAFAESGWDVNAYVHHEGNTLAMAVRRIQVEAVKWLLTRGAKPEFLNGVSSTLGDAGGHASPEIISALVESGIGVKGSRALEMAAREGQLDNAVQLLKLGADVNELADMESWLVGTVDMENGVGTPLHAAVSTGQKAVAMVSLLLKNGAYATITDSKGRTAAELAKQMKHKDIVAILEKHE